MEGIQVSVQTAGSAGQISIIKVGGYIDTTTSSEVERALNSLLKQGRFQIIIDLGNVDYISSAGWGIFISEIKAIRENNGDLKLVQMIPDVYEIFELLEFHHILDVYDTVPAAINKFEESQYVEMVPKTEAQPQRVQPYGGEQQQQPQQPQQQPPRPPQPTPTPGNYNNNPFQQQQQQQPSRPTPPPPPPPTNPQQPQQPKRPNILDLVNMSVENKIKYLVAQNPNMGAYKINKRLNSADFGFTKVGWFGVRSWLSKLGLNSRQNRRRFAANYRNM